MPALFTLDPNGTLRPRDEEARRQLEGRAGELELMPSSKDWTLFLRPRPTGEDSQQPRVVLAGDAACFPVADLIAFLGQSRWTGVLRFHAKDGRRALWLSEGDVRGAHSENPLDRLGEVMVRLGHVQRSDLEAVLRSVPPSKIGRALVDRGHLQSHDLYKCLTEQVHEIFHAIVAAKEGAFVLVDQNFDEKASSALQLSTQSLLMDSIRKIDELAHFRKRIPHLGLFPMKRREADDALEDEERQVLGVLTGQVDLRDIARAVRMSEFDVTKTMHRLLEGGYVQLLERAVDSEALLTVTGGVKPGRSAATVGPGRDFQIVVHTFNEIFRSVFASLERVGQDDAFLVTANAALAQGGLTESPLTRGLAFSKVGELSQHELWLRYQAARDSLGTKPLFVFKQSLSDVMYFLIFQAAEVLEPERGEMLGHTAKQLLSTLDWV